MITSLYGVYRYIGKFQWRVCVCVLVLCLCMCVCLCLCVCVCLYVGVFVRACIYVCVKYRVNQPAGFLVKMYFVLSIPARRVIVNNQGGLLLLLI